MGEPKDGVFGIVFNSPTKHAGEEVIVCRPDHNSSLAPPITAKADWLSQTLLVGSTDAYGSKQSEELKGNCAETHV